ncbi:hypothetical protein HJC23_003911 [Cyclotella cryptica]|uniref:Uncharacterized protein n=1 Tax=Cyclotella cryptica TaxID=29204 RepID=A0ABD3PVI8_9STRA
MTGRARAIGGNVILASLLAALSYLPFELIAKSTLIVCIAMFVADPFPTSRLVSVGGVAVVLLLTRVRSRFVESPGNVSLQTKRDQTH